MSEVSTTLKKISFNYRPDIDGLRAVAVLPVLFFHAEIGCPGGFVGVDVFFVISGFLITSLILKDIGDGAFSLINFWERRLRRIFPALALVVLFTIVAGWCLYLPKDFETLGKSVVAQTTLLSNFFFWKQSDKGYFAASPDTMPLLHTWSLAVEEQFYVLFPLFLSFLATRKKILLPQIILCLAIGSFAISVVGSYIWAGATFYLLPTRAWELSIGALLAVTHRKLSLGQTTREIFGWLGLGLICYAVFCYDRQTRFPGFAAIPPCLGAAMIIFSSEEKPSLVGRILAFKPLAFVGLISYSLYLWHWPLLVFSRYLALDQKSVLLGLAMLGASAVLATISWKYVELPFRQRRIFPRYQYLFGFAGVSGAVLLGLGILVNHYQGFPSRFSAKSLYYADINNHLGMFNDITLEQAVAGRFFELGSRDTNKSIKVVVWGDSHAMSVTQGIDDLCRKHSERGIQATHSATAPVLGYASRANSTLKGQTIEFNNAVLSFIAKERVDTVIIAARWSAYPATDSFKTQLLATVRATLDCGAKVYILKDVPSPGFNVPRLAAIAAKRHADVERLALTQEKYQLRNREYSQTFEQIARMGATVLDPTFLFINTNGLYGTVKSNQVLYWDSHHLTAEGSRLLTPLFEPIFQQHP